MDIKDLIYITTIAEEKNLSAAGKKLSVSQPTLSTFLSGLEDRLGENLFYREKKQLLPTAAGKIYLEAAQKIIRIHDQTYFSIRRLQSPGRECITIAATPLRGSIMFASIYPVFSQRYPDIRLELRESYMGGILKQISAGEVDLALGSFPDPESPYYDYVTFSREEIVLAIPSFHKMAANASRDPAHLSAVSILDFKDDSFVLLSPGTTIRSVSDNIFATAGIHPLIIFETSNNLVIASMVRQGAGIGFLPRSMVQFDDRDIVYLSLRPQYFMNLGLIIKKGRTLRTPERYIAYLVMKQDRIQPLYLPGGNQTAEEIIREFAEGNHT